MEPNRWQTWYDEGMSAGMNTKEAALYANARYDKHLAEKFRQREEEGYIWLPGATPPPFPYPKTYSERVREVLVAGAYILLGIFAVGMVALILLGVE